MFQAKQLWQNDDQSPAPIGKIDAAGYVAAGYVSK